MSAKLVSVVMTVFNTQDFLEAAVQSVLDQSYQDFELIIVNDGSTDRSADLISKFAKKDSRVRSISQENMGMARARNLGVTLSNGTYIAIHDSDDISLEDRLETQVREIERQPELAALGTFMTTFGNGFESTLVTKPIRPLSLHYQAPWANPLLHPTALIRRSVFDAVGGYRPEVTDDIDFWSRVLVDHQVANVPIPLVRYRRHESQHSNISHRLSMNDSAYEARRKFVENFHGDDILRHFTRDVHDLLGRRPTVRADEGVRSQRIRFQSRSFLIRTFVSVKKRLGLNLSGSDLEMLKVFASRFRSL